MPDRAIAAIFGNGISATALAKLLRYNGKLVGRMYDTAVESSPVLYTGCFNKRYCLPACQYSLGTRNMRNDYATFTVSGIVDTSCGPATRTLPTGFFSSITESIQCSGFAAANGAYVMPVTDHTSGSGCYIRFPNSQYDFTATIRYYGFATARVGGGTTPFDTTCTVLVRVNTGCVNPVAPVPCEGPAIDIACRKVSPTSATPFNPESFFIFRARYTDLFPCRIAGDEELGLAPIDGHWYTYTSTGCSPYPECVDSPYDWTVCCPFSSLTISLAWS